ncbi:MAG: tRNA (N6-threonylcarbamoyladenosine(37)-N6)-methyltransferase TrmO [Planctomycetes bacterium]|jgi:tRNA-Thr(GGU) m(6)t(6)A37 methyltransferase TsaA|nr:tRNA (N6-threonylcarbamoyladenosine(37)-N6)-methyltransferase TrmO [Planctomycetota bacterium]
MSSRPRLIIIGWVHSPFKELVGTPIQPVLARGAEGTVEILPEHTDGLQDLAGFERIWLLYWFDRAPPARLRVIPFRDEVPRGLFATRMPCRPNPAGISCVRLLGIRDRTLRIGDVDILDGTPVLDIKPYVPEYDAFPGSRAGWLESCRNRRTRADGRMNPKTLG